MKLTNIFEGRFNRNTPMNDVVKRAQSIVRNPDSINVIDTGSSEGQVAIDRIVDSAQKVLNGTSTPADRQAVLDASLNALADNEPSEPSDSTHVGWQPDERSLEQKAYDALDGASSEDAKEAADQILDLLRSKSEIPQELIDRLENDY